MPPELFGVNVEMLLPAVPDIVPALPEILGTDGLAMLTELVRTFE